jgi:heptaprenyl diphosphate synthase
MLHLASLHHDDVMDRATQRRHGRSVNATWGERAAVLAGSYLVARAVQVIDEVAPEASAATARALTDLCTGQLLESENAFDTELTQEEHRTVITLKTATLFELPFTVGGVVAGLDRRTVTALVEYGRDLGVAFQLVDDALDVRGSAETLGKRPLSDVREGVYTQSVLRVLAGGGPQADQMRALLTIAEPTDADMAQVARLVLDSGALDAALQDARGCTSRALSRLSKLPDGPVRESLARLADLTVERTQ